MGRIQKTVNIFVSSFLRSLLHKLSLHRRHCDHGFRDWSLDLEVNFSEEVTPGNLLNDTNRKEQSLATTRVRNIDGNRVRLSLALRITKFKLKTPRCTYGTYIVSSQSNLHFTLSLCLLLQSHWTDFPLGSGGQWSVNKLSQEEGCLSLSP